MVELVDTRDLKSLDRNIVPVQVRPRVPFSLTMKYWHVATYKLNEIKRVETNLLNQKFDYYLPKITTKKINSSPKEKILFPGYIFINISSKNFTSLKYTKGIKKIVKFGKNIPYISENEIKNIKIFEESSKLEPVISKIKIGQEALIKSGSFKGHLVKISSLPSKKRVEILLNFLGSKRIMSIPENQLEF